MASSSLPGRMPSSEASDDGSTAATRNTRVSAKNDVETGPVRGGLRVVRAGDRIRTGDVQLGKLAFYH